jgi:hypothetical protein
MTMLLPHCMSPLLAQSGHQRHPGGAAAPAHPRNEGGVWPTIRLSTAQILVHVGDDVRCGTRIMRVGVIGAATLTLLFVLFAAPSFHAQAREERLVPPLPIPHVNRTVAIHLPAAASSQPQPRSRPATTAPGPLIPPKRTLVPIND